MKKEIEDIKELIRRDEIEKALEKAKQVVSIELSNSIILISNRYKKWKRERNLGIGDNLVVRNSVINDFLNVLTEEENTQNNPLSTAMEISPILKVLNTTNVGKEGDMNGIEDGRLQVFISYSHKDKKYLEDLKRHFKPLATKVHFWDDTSIEAGEKWHNEIKARLIKAKIAILLISADFFNSDFILNNELPSLLKSAENKGAKILSIFLKPCLWEEYSEINQYQALNSPTKPMSSMDKTSRELIWVELVRTVKKVMSTEV